MEFLSEDPTYLVGGFAIAGLICLVATKVTQQGKYLIWAAVSLGLALLFFAIEWSWVTDNERVEAVVYDLAKAVASSDPDKGEKAASYLDKGCRIEVGNEATSRMIQIVTGQFGGRDAADWLRDNLKNYHFDYLRITKLRTNAGVQSRQGTADFVAYTMGNRVEPFAGFAAPGGMAWSFGLREVSPGVWKITRITPGRIDLSGGGYSTR